ncbi:Uncharacterised protein [Mycobacteroides abscessus subsp. abscessus]|nr:Uncharacterised protein [Mycobacteroides abscessus subsp. abscessus]
MDGGIASNTICPDGNRSVIRCSSSRISSSVRYITSPSATTNVGLSVGISSNHAAPVTDEAIMR